MIKELIEVDARAIQHKIEKQLMNWSYSVSKDSIPRLKDIGCFETSRARSRAEWTQLSDILRVLLYMRLISLKSRKKLH